MSLKDKVAIVSGGGRDIGKACVEHLAKQGAKVLFTYFSSSSSAQAIVDEIIAAGGQAACLKADLTDKNDADLVVATALETFGQIDVLVHVSGGLIGRKTIAEMEPEHWRDVMAVNLDSLYYLTHAAIPKMNEGGSIINFASQAGRDGGGPGAVAYAASKGAVMSFTRGLAKELGPKIRVNALCPGMISTTFHDTFTADEVRGKVAGATALKREGNANEVAELVCYLASDGASYLTGNCIDINGGLLFS